MLNRFATLAAVCLLVPVATAPLAAADPIPGPPPPDGAVESADPAILATPDGWLLTALGRNETQVPVPPLTTALTSREYIVGGTFSGSVRGKGSGKLAGGTLDVGYQISCGIELKRVELVGTAGVTPGFGATGALATLAIPINGATEVELGPGIVKEVPVDKKVFTGTDPRVSVTDLHIKVDGCVGQSYLRSYATLTSSTEANDSVVTYLGNTMAY